MDTNTHTQVRHVMNQLWQHVRTPVQSPGGQGGGGGGGGGKIISSKISNPVATGPRGSVGARAGRGGGGEKGREWEGGGEEGGDHAVAIDLLLGMGFSRAQVPCVCVCVCLCVCVCARVCVCAYWCGKPVTKSCNKQLQETCNKQFRRSVPNTWRDTRLPGLCPCMQALDALQRSSFNTSAAVELLLAS